MRSRRVISILTLAVVIAACFAGNTMAYAADSDTKPSGYEIASVSVGTGNIAATLTAEEDCTMIAVRYDEDGKMVEVKVIPVPRGKNQTIYAELETGPDVPGTISVFLVDAADSEPLIQKQSRRADRIDTVLFGHYEQDNDLMNGKEPIEWRVLAVEDGKALLISEYALDCQPYHRYQEDITWADCTLRSWLNNIFLNEAFTAQEQELISTVTVTADIDPDFGTEAGSDTQDKVFLLSSKEAMKYFEGDVADEGYYNGYYNKSRACRPTAYAIAQGCILGAGDDWWDGNCSWWLRTPGWNQSFATSVFISGAVVCSSPERVSYANDAIRPALWVELGS